MTIDKSLKVRRGATSTRSVLTRAERLERLKENDRWTEGMSPIGIPKVRVKKLSLKKKKKTKKEEDETGKGGKAAPAKGGKK
jgi:small basic protein (TIGR04137 family)